MDKPDPNGQAAILLVESLIHTLVDRDILTTRQALFAIASAICVKSESAAFSNEDRETLEKSLGVMKRIEQTLQAGDPTPARED